MGVSVYWGQRICWWAGLIYTRVYSAAYAKVYKESNNCQRSLAQWNLVVSGNSSLQCFYFYLISVICLLIYCTANEIGLEKRPLELFSTMQKNFDVFWCNRPNPIPVLCCFLCGIYACREIMFYVFLYSALMSVLKSFFHLSFCNHQIWL